MSIRDENNIPGLLRVLDELGRHRVEIGIFGDQDGDVLMIASVHEFGCRIQVTDRMRGWFAAQGYPLRKDTTEINIPERSFMRSGFDQNVDKIDRQAQVLLEQVLALKLSTRAFYEALGGIVVGVLQEFLTDLRDPANTAMTVERKRSSNPLIDGGRMRQAITWRVVGA